MGGSQRLAIHRTLSGGRVVDVSGADDADIKFSGIMSGPNAVRRAQTLDAMRLSQAIQILTWNELLYPILLRELTFEVHDPYWIAYRMECAVVPWTEVAITAITAVDQIAMDVSCITEIDAGVSPSTDTASGALGSLMLAPEDTEAQLTAARAVGDVQISVETDRQTSDQALAGFGTQRYETPGSLVTCIQQLDRLTREVWSLTACLGYWSRIAANLADMRS
jgi:hypothetical protein